MLCSRRGSTNCIDIFGVALGWWFDLWFITVLDSVWSWPTLSPHVNTIPCLVFDARSSFERNQSELIFSGVLLTLPLLFPQLFNLRRRPIDDQHGRFNETGFGIFYWFIALISSYCSELPVELFLNNKASGRRFLLSRGLLVELVVMRGISSLSPKTE